MPKKSFTLVELMIAVSILSIGIVVVLRSFLTTQEVLETAVNRLSAIRFLEEKMGELEEMAAENKEIIAEDSPRETKEEEVALGSRQAIFRTEIAPLEIAAEEETKKSPIDEVTLTLSWKEGNKDKDEVLVAYVERKK